MKALVKYKKDEGNISIIDMPEPKIPDDDWVKIKVMAAGICGTDLHIWHDQFPYWPPVILGHEFSGEVVEIGPKVKEFKVGDRVVAEPHSLACGMCELCRQGRVQLCKSKRSPGWGIDGAFTEYIVMPELLLHRIPDEISYEIAALTEPIAIAIHQVTERCGIESQDFVVITGAGPIGIIAAFIAKSAGAGTVVVTGVNACEYVRFGVARELGADVIINIETEDALKRVLEMTDGRGADVVIETSGSQSAIGQSIEMLKTCGKLCAIGLSKNENANIPWNKAVLKSLDIICCMSSSYTAWNKALSLMKNTDMDLRKLITHRLSLEEWQYAFEELEAERGIKAIFV